MNKHCFFIVFMSILVSIQLRGQDIYEPNNSYLEAATIDCESFFEGFIQELEDYDWYKIDFVQAGYLEIELTSLPAQTDLNLEIHMLKDGQLVLIADDDFFNNQGQDMSAVAFVEPGTYYFVISDENDDGSDPNDSYELNVSCIYSEAEVNQTVELAYPISNDTCFVDRIYGENLCYFDYDDEDNDKDWFSVVLGHSGSLVVEVSSFPSSIDLNLEIYTYKDNQLVQIAVTLVLLIVFMERIFVTSITMTEIMIKIGFMYPLRIKEVL